MRFVWKKIKFYHFEKVLITLYFIINSCFVFVMTGCFYERAVGPATLYDNLINDVYYETSFSKDIINSFHFPIITCNIETMKIEDKTYEVYITNGDLSKYGIPVGFDVYFPVSFNSNPQAGYVYLESSLPNINDTIEFKNETYKIEHFNVNWKSYNSFFASYKPNNPFILFYDEDYDFSFADFAIIDVTNQEITENEEKILRHYSTGESIREKYHNQNKMYLLILSIALILPTFISFLLFFQLQKNMTFSHSSNWKILDLLGISFAKLFNIILLENIIFIALGTICGIFIGCLILSCLSIIPNIVLGLIVLIFAILSTFFITLKNTRKMYKIENLKGGIL